MSLRVAVTCEVKRHEARSRSESEPEEGGIKLDGVDAKPSDLHMARVKSR